MCEWVYYIVLQILLLDVWRLSFEHVFRVESNPYVCLCVCVCQSCISVAYCLWCMRSRLKMACTKTTKMSKYRTTIKPVRGREAPACPTICCTISSYMWPVGSNARKTLLTIHGQWHWIPVKMSKADWRNNSAHVLGRNLPFVVIKMCCLFFWSSIGMIEWHHLGDCTRVQPCRWIRGWYVGWDNRRLREDEEKVKKKISKQAEEPRVWHVWLFLAPTFNKRQMLVDIAPAIYIYIYILYIYVMSGGGWYFDTVFGVGRLRFPWNCKWLDPLTLGGRRKRRSQKWLLCEPWVFCKYLMKIGFWVKLPKRVAGFFSKRKIIALEKEES